MPIDHKLIIRLMTEKKINLVLIKTFVDLTDLIDFEEDPSRHLEQ